MHFRSAEGLRCLSLSRKKGWIDCFEGEIVERLKITGGSFLHARDEDWRTEEARTEVFLARSEEEVELAPSEREVRQAPSSEPAIRVCASSMRASRLMIWLRPIEENLSIGKARMEMFPAWNEGEPT
jgi:hypothetical protein